MSMVPEGEGGVERVSETVRDCLGMVVENQVHESLLWTSTLLKASCLQSRECNRRFN